MEAPQAECFLLPMSRSFRPHMPGLAFHITARTQGEEPWFVERLRGTIDRYIVEGVTSSDSMLLARTVMPNHFHIVVRQGTRSLGWVMQPIMRRVALLIQRAYEKKGHVFERRFRAVACENADHLRRAIVYTHINPLRAHLCADLTEYAWCSHDRYVLDGNGCVVGIEIVHALKLFGDVPTRSIAELSEAYLRYVSWRREKDRHEELDIPFAIPEPLFAAGDTHFSECFSALALLSRSPQKDLRDKAIELLERIDRNMPIDGLRRRDVPRPVTAIRNQLIAALLQAGYRGKQIADFLRLSDSTVSAVASAMRYAAMS